MVTFTHKIADANGLHARNAMGLVQGARALAHHQIHVGCKGRRVDACQVMGLMGLTARCGDELVFSIEGPQEEEGAKALQALAEEIL